jgi:hypothetical protein
MERRSAEPWFADARAAVWFATALAAFLALR